VSCAIIQRMAQQVRVGDHRRAVDQFLLALVLLTVICVLFSGFRTLASGSLRYLFLIWNLFLAWLPLLFALWWRRTGKPIWRRWLLAAAWLAFLPNSFYLITDFIHLTGGQLALRLYDAVLLFSFSITGLILGFVSLHIMERRAQKHFGQKMATVFVISTLLASSFAIYLGRFLGWNSWDIISNPFGILFDISNQLLDTSRPSYGLMTTVLFFVLLSSLYYVQATAIALVRSSQRE
jgi:uncharacterized membrane protein